MLLIFYLSDNCIRLFVIRCIRSIVFDAVSLHQDFVELYRQRRGIAHLQANGLDVGVDVLVFVVPQERSVLFPDFLPLLSLTPKLDGGRLVVAFSF